jgi:uncharacterized protein YgbK (DUF1537 family)
MKCGFGKRKLKLFMRNMLSIETLERKGRHPMTDTNTAELIKALRACSTGEIGVCDSCPYFNKHGEAGCNLLESDAASVIESQDAQIADLTAENERLRLMGENEIWRGEK